MMSFTKISLESSISLQSNQIHLLITKKWLSSQMFHPLQVNAKWYTEIKKNHLVKPVILTHETRNRT